jgi:hypothetical protein
MREREKQGVCISGRLFRRARVMLSDFDLKGADCLRNLQQRLAAWRPVSEYMCYGFRLPPE